MSTYDTTSGGLTNAGLIDGAGQTPAAAEQTRDALDTVGATPRRVFSAARRPVPVAAAALLLAGAAAATVLMRRRAAARRSGWKRFLNR